MQYSISQSDNNACDILIEYAGGIKHINDYIHRLSIDSFNLSETEDGMHSSFEAVYRNWSTPSAMARLLRTADEKELFSNKELKDFLWQTMIDTETGANKLKVCCQPNRGRTQDRLFRPQCRRYENCR